MELHKEESVIKEGSADEELFQPSSSKKQKLSVVESDTETTFETHFVKEEHIIKDEPIEEEDVESETELSEICDMQNYGTGMGNLHHQQASGSRMFDSSSVLDSNPAVSQTTSDSGRNLIQSHYAQFNPRATAAFAFIVMAYALNRRNRIEN